MLTTVLSKIAAVIGLTPKSTPTNTVVMSITTHVGAPFEAELIPPRRRERARNLSHRARVFRVQCRRTSQFYNVIVPRMKVDHLSLGERIVAKVYHPAMGRFASLPAQIVLQSEPGIGATAAQIARVLLH